MPVSKYFITLAVAFFVALISSVKAFGLAPRRVRTSGTSLKMARGIQKVGQSVISINIQTVEVPVSSPDSVFGRITLTSGHDERKEYVNEEQHSEELSLLDLNFRKQGLMNGLVFQWGKTEALERIHSASAFEGLLPSSLNGGLTTASMKAGGLTDDWDFDFGN